MRRGGLTAARLRDLVHYDPDTGVFTRRERTLSRGRRSSMGGRVLGGKGWPYPQISIDNCLYQSHYLAWLYMTGEPPAEGVDHRDLDKTNPAWKNLRAAPQSLNGRNLPKSKANRTGLKGVARYRPGYWTAQIHLAGKKHHLGVFDCKAAGHFAYLVASAKLHGEFGRGA